MAKNTAFALLVSLLICLVAMAHAADAPATNNWPQWRGPLNNGISPNGNPPSEWSESSNIKWKVNIPGKGSSTPIISGEKVFILTAVSTAKPNPKDSQTNGSSPLNPGGLPEAMKKFDKNNDGMISEAERREARRAMRRGGNNQGRRGFGASTPKEVHQFIVICYNKNNGELLWKQVAREELPHEGHHRDHGFASASPVTDGEHVYAYFGSRGLYCYDMEGNLKWEKDFGDMKTRNSFGEGTSPLLHGDKLVINWDHEGDSFILLIDKKTGDTIWRKNRDEKTSWTTPHIAQHQGKKQIIVPGANKILAYDFETGNIVWESSGLTANVVPCAVSGNGMVYVMSGFRGAKLQAIRLGHTGQLLGTEAIAWTYESDTPYVPSPLLYNDRLYFFKTNTEILSCLNATSGKKLFGPQRVEGIKGVYASIVGANDRIYLLGRTGTCTVIKSSDKYEVITTNKLDDNFEASPAIAGNELFLRGQKHLYCIAQ